MEVINKLDKEFGSKFVYDKDKIVKYFKLLKWYSIDPSIADKSQEPLGFFYAKDKEDISELLEICNSERIPIVPKSFATTNFGQLVLFKPSIILDMQNFEKKIEIVDDNYVEFSSGAKVIDVLNYLRKRGKDLRVYPSSFYMSSLAGFISGGSGGTGSYQYGYYFENDGLRKAKIIGPTGEYELKGKEALAVSQAAGSNGIILEGEMAIIDYLDWKDQIVRFENLYDSIKFVKNLKGNVRRVAIEDGETLDLVMKGKIDVGKWNVVLSSYESIGEEIEDLKIVEKLAGSGIYVLIRNLNVLKNYSHDALVHIPLNKFAEIVKPIKDKLGNKVLIHGDVEKIKGEYIVDTTIMTEREYISLIDDILYYNGIKIPFKPPTLVINEWLNDKEKLELMRKYKKIVDPYNILNPGKLI
ncbi:FAD-binding protein [Acidianus sulfidivorans JP7]|uniref:FAD-linked oxidase n=1 Tax=Acidianus sulfidivorans JP7 TaxID=619593 RepID=A0A2U9ILD8_9CREN|nr:FAD-binding oxidoreductase [Acidianus sulfidivorans]AWR96842.1 FAD-binding protein [Acidianus sulfidivorans JP7]